jgi:hypothetical protein
MALGAAGTAAAAATALRQRVARLIQGEREVKALERRGAPAAVVSDAEQTLAEQARETKMAFKKVLAQVPGAAAERGVNQAKHAFKRVVAEIQARGPIQRRKGANIEHLRKIFENPHEGSPGSPKFYSWQADHQRSTSQTLGGRTLMTEPQKWTPTPLSEETPSTAASTPTPSASSPQHYWISGPNSRHTKVGNIQYHRIDSDSDSD